jgi:3-dehydroquinate dehydratase-1
MGMNLDRFVLAATTDDLTREKHVREWADAVEFRMDSADDPLTQLSAYDGDLPIIATNRGQWFGGKAHDSGRLDTLFEAAKSDAVRLVDIELETARGTSWVLEEFRKEDVDLIISFHEFDGTPDVPTLGAIFEDCAEYGDVAKVATYANERADALRMLQAVNDATEDGLRVAGISMGEIGRHTRAVAPVYGSKLGYAPLESDESEYAPGQIPIDELASLIEALGVNEDGVRQELGLARDSTTSREAVKIN